MGGSCNLKKGEVFVGQFPKNRFEVIFSETFHLMLTSSRLRKRGKQSIRACSNIMSLCGRSWKIKIALHWLLFNKESLISKTCFQIFLKER